jgi:hypothetical protein
MIQRPGCLAPIALVFVTGCLLLIVGLMAESDRLIGAGAGFLVGTVVLLVLGWWLRKQGWWA